MASQTNDMNHSDSAPLSPDRRRWLVRSGTALAAALGAGSMGNLLSVRPAYAADYKALVCIFLFGGNDGMNTIVPIDATRYPQYASVRGSLAIPQGSLLTLGSTNFGLHPALSGLQTAWNDGALAPVFNVGPLVQPLTKAQYVAAAAATSTTILPDNLFSHEDQQTLWQGASGDSFVRTGWGGRASDAIGTVNPVISVSGGSRFGLSDMRQSLVVPPPGYTFGASGLLASDNYTSAQLRQAAVTAEYAQTQEIALANAYAGIQQNAFAMSSRLNTLISTAPGSANATAAIDAAFAPLISGGSVTTPLGAQLYQIAQLIAGNATVQGNRQIFFASLGNFDTHGGQVVTGTPTTGAQATLLKQVGDALGAFYGALKALGLSQAVTSFTQSDFGRTFAPNNSTGTDHGWGNHHLVMGGSVHGATTYGTYPSLVLGGNDDVGVNSWELQGRWIPTTSVDQYAATLLSWFGASSSQLATVLPNLANYTTTNLGFV